MKTGSRTSRAFTLMELLVSIGIIVVLLGISFTIVRIIRNQVIEMTSASNIRQWGIANALFLGDHNQVFSRDGWKQHNQMSYNFEDPLWWGNALPEYIGSVPYAEYAEAAATTGDGMTVPPADSIFVDPAADLPSIAGSGNSYLWRNRLGYVVANDTVTPQRCYFFSYVPNAQLENTLVDNANQNAIDIGAGPLNGFQENNMRIRLSQIPDPTSTVQMIEKRTSESELPLDDPFYDEDLKRQKSDWQRFAARHRGGGHLLFIDGHVEWMSNVDATTPNDPQYPRGEGPDSAYDKPNLIWDPIAHKQTWFAY